ncbi:unnamed protein product [Anisakis simplex]|uniref:PH domain-containing protein n=1 Tax=Anisakis simplex TaxID=6269 RepID=A0A0M3J224_ANISI|nr:unnamed protein product [Anisakis simplex]
MARGRKFVRESAMKNAGSDESSNGAIVTDASKKIISKKPSVMQALTWPKRYWAEVGKGKLCFVRITKSSKGSKSERISQSPNDTINIDLLESPVKFDDRKFRIHFPTHSGLDYFCPLRKMDYEPWKGAVIVNRCYKPSEESVLFLLLLFFCFCFFPFVFLLSWLK